MLHDLDCDVRFAGSRRQVNDRVALDANIDDGLLVRTSDELVDLKITASHEKVAQEEEMQDQILQETNGETSAAIVKFTFLTFFSAISLMIH